MLKVIKVIFFIYKTIILIVNKLLKLDKKENIQKTTPVVDSNIDENQLLLAQKLTLFDEFEFYKQSYYYEIDIQEKLNSRATTFVSLLPLLLSVLLYFYKDTFKLIKKLSYFPISTLSYFLFLIVLTFIFFYIVNKLYTTIHGNEYRYTPTLKEIYDYKKQLFEDYNYTIEEVDVEMKNFLTESLVNSTTTNKLTNHKKINSFRGNTNLLCFFLFVAIIVFFLHINVDSKKIPEKMQEKSKVIYVRG